MATPKKKFRGEKARVYTTKAGSQYVRPSDVIMSEKAKDDIRRIRETFEKPTNSNPKNGTSDSSGPKR